MMDTHTRSSYIHICYSTTNDTFGGVINKYGMLIGSFSLSQDKQQAY